MCVVRVWGLGFNVCASSMCTALLPVARARTRRMQLLPERGGGRGGEVHAAAACTSHVTHAPSHVTRHTPHVTRHTSHVTRHTSHVTRHTCPNSNWERARRRRKGTESRRGEGGGRGRRWRWRRQQEGGRRRREGYLQQGAHVLLLHPQPQQLWHCLDAAAAAHACVSRDMHAAHARVSRDMLAPH